jgi:hypothetical protein
MSLPTLANSFWQQDALLYSISSNAEHGLPRSNADKRKAVRLLLADAEWGQWSDRESARHCQVSVNGLSAGCGRAHLTPSVRWGRAR